MGLVFRRSEIMEFTGNNNAMLEEKILRLEMLVRACGRFVAAGELQGEGWVSAKALFGRVLLPLFKLQIQHSEALMRANGKVSSLMNGELVGDDVLIEDGLEESLRQARANLASLEQQLQHMIRYPLPNLSGTMGINPLIAVADSQTAEVRATVTDLERKLKQLRAYDNAIKGLYREAEECRRRIERALSAVRGKAWNSGAGRFVTAGIDISWASGVDKYWAGREESYDKVTWYRKCFGMDRIQAQLFVEFERKFTTHAKEQGWDTQQAQYEYMRVLASAAYGGTAWQLAAGTYDSAGLSGVLAEIGFKDTEGVLFKYAVITQNLGRDVSGLNRVPSHQVGFAHLAGAIACILKVHRNWAEKGSVAYGGATMGLRNNSLLDFLLQVTTDYSREAATFAGDIASGSFPEKDIRADLDAINLTDRLAREPDTPVGELLAKYYSGIDGGKVSRTDDFLRHYARAYADSDNPQKGYEFVTGHVDEMLATPGVASLGEGKDSKDQREAQESFLRFLNENRSCYATD